jgi:hypothetical protein
MTQVLAPLWIIMGSILSLLILFLASSGIVEQKTAIAILAGFLGTCALGVAVLSVILAIREYRDDEEINSYVITCASIALVCGCLGALAIWGIMRVLS